MTRRGWMTAAVALAVTLGAAIVGAQGDKYVARLSRVPIAGPNDAQYVAGKGSVTATVSGSKLTLSGSFEDLVAPATVARLHRGVAKGARGPVVADLTVTKGATKGTISGALDLSPPDQEALEAGRLYVQVHSEKGLPKEDGATLWGWLLR